MKKTTKQTLLKGEGANQHTLYGDFLIDEKPADFANLSVTKDSVLKHEEPNGNHAEHESLKVEKGNWVMGVQKEWNPFSQSVNRVWD